MSSADNVLRVDYTADKIAQLYSALPRRYPRIKAIHWFDMNAMKYAPPARRLNNYALLEEDGVKEAYLNAVSDPYFLPQVLPAGKAVAPAEIAPLAPGETLAGKVRLSAYVKTYEEHPTVRFTVGGKTLKTFTTPGRYDWVLDTTKLPNGPTDIVMEVRDAQGKVAGGQTVGVKIDNSVATVARNLTLAAEASAPVVTGFALPGGAAPVKPPVFAEGDFNSNTKPGNTAKIQTDLAALVSGAAADPARLSLSVLPEDSKLPLGSLLRFDMQAKADGYLFLTLTTNPANGGESEITLLSPRGVTDPEQIATQAKVSAGETIGIPKDRNRGLKPSAAGKFTVRAVLLPTLEAAQAYAKSLNGATKTSEVANRQRLARLTDAGNAKGAVKAERTVEIAGQ
jgi:hypothetical protein